MFATTIMHPEWPVFCKNRAFSVVAGYEVKQQIRITEEVSVLSGVLFCPGLEHFDGLTQDTSRTTVAARASRLIVKRPPFMEAACAFDSLHHGIEIAIGLRDVALPDQILDHTPSEPSPVAAVLVAVWHAHQ